MSDLEQINVSMRTTKFAWNHIIKLIQKDTDPAWTQFNTAFIKIIEDTIKRSTDVPISTHSQPKYRYGEDDSPESSEYRMDDDGRYHHDDHFNEKYGSYSNYSRLSDEADDAGFPDAESYQNWLDD